MRKFIAPTLLIGLAALTGCQKQYIPNTDVIDSEENRDAVAFCEGYRKAVERRDIAAILKLVSPDYFEDGGNVDATDDLDVNGFKEFLRNRFTEAKAIRHEMRYRRVTWDNIPAKAEGGQERRRAYVDYTYSASFQIPGVEKRQEWQRAVEENRLVLEAEGDSFKIVAGM